jgi:hypothetical protein
MNRFGIAQPVRRVEDVRFITGRGQPEQAAELLQKYFLLGPIAHFFGAIAQYSGRPPRNKREAATATGETWDEWTQRQLRGKMVLPRVSENIFARVDRRLARIDRRLAESAARPSAPVRPNPSDSPVQVVARHRYPTIRDYFQKSQKRSGQWQRRGRGACRQLGSW